MESKEIFEVAETVPNARKIVSEIVESVGDDILDGRYDDARIGYAERSNLHNIRKEDEYLKFYLRCLHNGATVDINDWEIEEKRGGLKGKLLLKYKTIIWKSLKFYTFRFWSQQNQINSFFATALETTVERYESKIHQLETRIAELEEASGKRANKSDKKSDRPS